MSQHFLFDATLASAFTAAGILIVDAAFKGTILLTMAGLVAWGLKRDSAATRHWVWLVAIPWSFFHPARALYVGALPQWRVLPAWITMDAAKANPLARWRKSPVRTQCCRMPMLSSRSRMRSFRRTTHPHGSVPHLIKKSA